MSDALVDGQHFRALTMIDDFSRESVYIGVGARFRISQVAQILTTLALRRAVPKKYASITGRNASMHIGFNQSRMPDVKSEFGNASTMRNTLIVIWGI